MNLADLANFICAKVRYTDSRSVSACKDFLKRRDEMIWNAALWRASIYQLDVTYDITDTLNAAGIYLLPRITDSVIGARTSDRALRIENQEFYFQQDFDVFSNTGTPLDFTVLPPSVWIGATAVQVSVVDEAAADVGAKVSVKWIDQYDEPHSDELTMTGAPVTLQGGNVKQITHLSKLATSAQVYLIEGSDIATSPALSSAGRDLTLNAGDTVYTPYIPLRLMQKPNQNTAVKVLVKKKYEPLDNDADESDLSPHIDNALIAYAAADMLERGRRFGQAKEFLAEAAALMVELKRHEAYQGANAPRIVPEGDEPSNELTYLTKGYW